MTDFFRVLFAKQFVFTIFSPHYYVVYVLDCHAKWKNFKKVIQMSFFFSSPPSYSFSYCLFFTRHDFTIKAVGLLLGCPPSQQWHYVWLKCKLILTLISTGTEPGDWLSLARSWRHALWCSRKHRKWLISVFVFIWQAVLSVMLITFFFMLC